MCYVIVTCRTLVWTLATVTSVVIVAGAVVIPKWLIGPQQNLAVYTWFHTNATNPHFRPSLGVFNRCERKETSDMTLVDKCVVYVTSLDMPSDEFPSLWKCSLVLFAIAVSLQAFTVLLSFLSVCVRAICTKSVFTTTGFLQSLSGLFLVVGLLLYPAGWGSELVRDLCGQGAAPFFLDKCSLGWAFYLATGGTALVLISALLSVQAEYSTLNQKIEAKMHRGKRLIFVC